MPPWTRSFHPVIAFSLPLLLALAPLAASPQARAQAPSAAAIARFHFAGKLLVVACDSDMLPSAYIDGKLGPPAATPDSVAVIRLDPTPPTPVTSPARLPVSTVAVTNSVTGPPAAVAVTPDGRFAVVAETQGPRPPRRPDATLRDLAPGRDLTVVDLRDPAHPRVTQRIHSHERATSVAFNRSGSLLAVAFSPKGRTAEVPLAVFPFHEGALGSPAEPKLPGFVPGDELNDAAFVPGPPGTPETLAIVIASAATPSGSSHPRLSLVHLTGSGAALTVAPWGEPVPLDPSPFTVRFTPDGRFALVNSMQQNSRHHGTVASIALASPGSAAPQHRVVSTVEAGELPEGLAVSPDARWVATANLEESFEPLSDPRQQFFSSVSLFHFDPATGTLARVGDFPFDGALPEPIVFDNSSRFLAVGSFSRWDDPSAGGSLHFFRIADHNPQPGRVELVHLSETLTLPRGPQSIAIVR